MTRRSVHAEPMAYRIQVRGRLSREWSDHLGGLSIDVSGEPGQQVTQLSGWVADQAALLGILNGLYDLGFPLMSVESLTHD